MSRGCFLILFLTMATFIVAGHTATLSVPTQEIVAKELSSPSVPIDSVLYVACMNQSGSGVIVKECYEDDKYVYYVLTSQHVIGNRFRRVVEAIDGLTGIPNYKIVVDDILVATDCGQSKKYVATVEAESREMDLALLKFTSDTPLADAVDLLPKDLESKLKITSEVHAIGCAFGMLKMTTKGILCLVHDRGPIRMMAVDSEFFPGSSGGGIFFSYGSKYYLIGIIRELFGLPFSPYATIKNAIYLDTIREFMEANGV